MSQESLKTKPTRPLETVDFEHGFHFSTKNGTYTGLTATSLSDFVSKMEIVDGESLMFHYPRGDFQKWIEDTLKDSELANRLCFVKSDYTAEELRKQLLKIARNRVNELKGPWLSRSAT